MADSAQVIFLRADQLCEAFKYIGERIREGFIFRSVVFQPKAEDVQRVRFAIQFRVKPRHEIIAV